MSVVVPELRYTSGGKPVAVSSQRKMVSVFPEGGASGYNPETQPTIRISLSPSLNFLDCHNSYLTFRVKQKAGTIDDSKECRMDKSALSWVRTFAVYGSNGQQLEYIDNFHLLTNLMTSITSPHPYRDSIGRMVDNCGDRGARNAAFAHPDGSMYSAGFDMSGLLSGAANKYLPLSYCQGSITIELTLAPFKEAFVGTAKSTSVQPSYVIDNCEYHASCVSMSEDYQARFSEQLRTRGIDMSISTFRTHHTTLNSDTVDLPISQNASSVKGVYQVLRSKNKYQSAKHDSLTTYKSGNLASVQYDLGGHQFPVAPITLQKDGCTDLYANNLQALNMYRNHSLGSSVDDTNFNSTEATKVPLGCAVGSYQALPIRRVYGTWCANGKEAYTAMEKGHFVERVTTDPVSGATLVNPAGAHHDLKHTKWVNTLHFIPHNAKDIHLIEQGLKCKIGTNTFPTGEDSTATNLDINGEHEYNNIVSDHNAKNALGMIADTASHKKTAGLGLDRFFKPTGAHSYGSQVGARARVPSSAKETNHEDDSKNVLYAGACGGLGL